ncbi:cytochrome c-type biogenesis protein CcsB [Desulfobotulus alkaliphilus]|uniref:Cytochrome c-type biogenesis protein CcsB n=1 Tax=Desulfobotulus alkaliphilus TaxID=622671 RepID=A0A562RQ35_9BACT|nr:c-type cytochrome biogenesis protein CcsB [Desulfobotulus alkaliphilus]TWI71237.1 cytochrome c-type biogenesis protein CcsB [Desulfobotulus alkaliphilus]
MNSSLILSIVTFVYGAAALLYISAWIFQKPLWGKGATALLWAGFLGNTAGFCLRWAESYQMGIGRIPLSNLYESLVFFSLTMAALYLFVEWKTGRREVGAFFGPLIFLAIAYASLSPNISDQIRPLVPALKSNWLTIHVVTCFLGYAGFALAFATSIMFLIHPGEGSNRGWRTRFPAPEVLDDLTYRMVVFGFLFLSLGIISGSVWANSAWGSYWSWDPKETWSLITWIIYAVLLHVRLMRSWTGKKIAWLSILGFAAVMFTYFGVNFLPGLHSYGSF